MRSGRTRWAAFCLAVLVLVGLAPTGLATPPEPEEDTLTVLFTHDTHDHFYPDAGDVGGYTRLATLLKEERARAEEAGVPTITVDGGDFSMGSLFQTVYATDAPELRALGAMGYDVATFGNHEFDYRSSGLARMLNTAAAIRDESQEALWSSLARATEEVIGKYGALCPNMPAIVDANYKPPAEDTESWDAWNNYGVSDYTVLERGGLTVAVFGVLGVDADECAPMSGMEFEPIADAARRVVAEIQEKVKPDYVICLSHSGTEDGKGEDYELAKAVDGIDLIISGHTHTTLPEPIEVNGTYIVSCGPYTQNLGKITLSRLGGQVRAGYELIPIDNTIPADEEMVELAGVFKTLVDQNYLAGYGLTYDQALAQVERDFTIPETGDLIGAAYIETVKQVEGESYVPIAFAVAPDGVIRDTLRRGTVTTANAFDILSLGVGADGTPGYPLISVYLTGKDLKNAFEVDASISSLMPAATLYGAGSHWKYNVNRMFLDRVTYSTLSYDGKASPIEDNRLYRVVADLYSGQMLGAVKAKSFGLLSVTPRDENGNEVTDFEKRILHNADGSEVKAWYALAGYLAAEGTVVPTVSSKTASTSWALGELLVPMGTPTLLMVLLAAVVLVLIVVIIYRVATRKKRKVRKAAKKAAKRAKREEKKAGKTGV